MTVSEAETSDEGPLSEGGFRRVTQRYDVPFQLGVLIDLSIANVSNGSLEDILGIVDLQ